MTTGPSPGQATVRVDADGTVAIVTIDRPDQMNALDRATRSALRRVFTDLDNDDRVHAIVLTGAGDAFSAGGDLDDILDMHRDADFCREELREARAWVDAMIGLRTPVLAAVNGPAVGLGCTTALLCDLVFISEDAYLCDPHVVVGLVAGDGASVLWPAATSLLRAKQYLLTGDRIPAREAERFGLANEVHAPDELMPRAVGYAKRVADLPVRAVQETKAALNLHLRYATLLTLPFAAMAEEHVAGLDDVERSVDRLR